MSSIFEAKIFYNWRVARRGWPYLTGCLITAMGAGAFASMARFSSHPVPFGMTRTEGLVGFVILAALTGFLWWKFSSLQDEMFHRIQSYSYGRGGAVAMAIMIVWGIANGATLAPPIDPFAPLFVFATAKAVFWTIATRRWL